MCKCEKNLLKCHEVPDSYVFIICLVLAVAIRVSCAASFVKCKCKCKCMMVVTRKYRTFIYINSQKVLKSFLTYRCIMPIYFIEWSFNFNEMRSVHFFHVQIILCVHVSVCVSVCPLSHSLPISLSSPHAHRATKHSLM